MLGEGEQERDEDEQAKEASHRRTWGDGEREQKMRKKSPQTLLTL